jgi:hypothetical protein
MISLMDKIELLERAKEHFEKQSLSMRKFKEASKG